MVNSDRTDKCLMHSGHEARIDSLEDCAKALKSKQDSIDRKLNYLLGGIIVLWPTIQLLVSFLGKK